jgi:hypothetical protein
METGSLSMPRKLVALRRKAKEKPPASRVASSETVGSVSERLAAASAAAMGF